MRKEPVRNSQKPRRVLAAALACLLLLTLLPVSALAEDTPAAPTAPTVKNNGIYANGFPIQIVAGSAEGRTNILYDVNGDSTIGETEYLQIGADTATAQGYDLSGYVVYGGSENVAVDSASVTMTGGTVTGVYGGGWFGAVTGDAGVTITGGTVTGSVCGGGRSGTVGGSASVTMSGGAVTYDVYGGGYGASEDKGKVTGDAGVTIQGSASVGGAGYGGGWSEGGTVGGKASVTIEGRASVGRIYGGGNNAPVGGDAGVIIRGSAAVTNSVYGGGYGASEDKGKVTGSAGVTIQGSASVGGAVYGGSDTATVTQNTSVTMHGGTVAGNLYGGGYGGYSGSGDCGAVGGAAGVTMNGGKVSGIHGGGYNAPVTGAASVAMDGGTVEYSVYGGGSGSKGTVGSGSGVTMSGGTVGNSSGGVSGVYGGGNGGAVTGNASVSITGGTVVNSVFGGGGSSGGTVTGEKTVTVGGGAKIGGTAGYNGVVINGGTGTPVANGVDSFVIAPDLDTTASVYVKLPRGIANDTVIATGAVQADLAKIQLVGAGADGKMPTLDGTEVKLAAAAAQVTTAAGVTTGYTTIGEALSALNQSGDTLKLLADQTGALGVGKSCTIDLNGKRWTGGSAADGATLSVSDSAVITLTNTAGVGSITGAAATDDPPNSSNAQPAVSVAEGATLTIAGDNPITLTGGTGTASMAGGDGIVSEGTLNITNNRLTVKGCEKPDGAALSVKGTATISGGTYSGYYGLAVEAGNPAVTLTGGTFIGTGCAIYGSDSCQVKNWLGTGYSYYENGALVADETALNGFQLGENTTITVKQAPSVYTVTFDATGGAVTSASGQTGVDGTLSTLPAPTRSGSYRFDGWYTAATGGEAVTTATVFNSNTTIYAHWTYTGGGSGGSSNTTTSTTTNADGSTTITTTNKSTGTVTETTKAKDGTKTVVETKKDGSKTETVTTPDGTKTETATTAQGNMTYTERRSDGTKISADIPKSGEATATVSLPSGTAAPVVASFPVLDGTVVLRLLPDGRSEPVALSLVEDGRVYVRLDGDAKLRVEKRAGLFDDMDGHWAEESADFTGARELFQGTAPNTFSPERPMTRAMLTTVLYRMDGTPAAGEAPFSDVENGSWCADGVAWAAENGIASGTGGGMFSAEHNITRQELAVMLWNYAKYDGIDVSIGEDTNILSFTDIDNAGEWAIPALQWACGAGILQGGTDGTLSPTDSATRAQVAAMLERFVAMAVK